MAELCFVLLCFAMYMYVPATVFPGDSQILHLGSWIGGLGGIWITHGCLVGVGLACRYRCLVFAPRVEVTCTYAVLPQSRLEYPDALGARVRTGRAVCVLFVDLWVQASRCWIE